MPSVGTGVSAGLSLISGRKAKKSADKSRGLQQAQLELMAERDEFNRDIVERSNELALQDRQDILDRRDRARGIYDPLEESIVDLATEGPDYAGAAARSDADVTQAFGVERGKERRRQQRYGVTPFSGAASEAQGNRLANAEALAKVYGRRRSREYEDDKDWARRTAAIGMGNMRNANAGVSLSQLGVPGAAGALGDMSRTYAADAAGGFSLMGKTAMDAVRNYGIATSPKPAAWESNSYFDSTDASNMNDTWENWK